MPPSDLRVTPNGSIRIHFQWENQGHYKTRQVLQFACQSLLSIRAAFAAALTKAGQGIKLDLEPHYSQRQQGQESEHVFAYRLIESQEVYFVCLLK